MNPVINANSKGRVTDVTCEQCHKLIPFSQPELSVDPSEATVMSHACPPQILADTQDAIQAASAQALADTVLT